MVFKTMTLLFAYQNDEYTKEKEEIQSWRKEEPEKEQPVR